MYGVCLYTCFFPAGAPSVATSSGQFAPGNATTELAALPRSHTVRMLLQSSKYDDEQCEATEVASTPRKPPAVVASIDIEDSPPMLVNSVPKDTPPSTGKSSRPDVRKQLSGTARRATPNPKKKTAGPKPEGYWKLLVQIRSSIALACMFVVYIHKPSTEPMELRVRRHFQPNSKGEVKCSPHVLELGRTLDGRALLSVCTLGTSDVTHMSLPGPL